MLLEPNKESVSTTRNPAQRCNEIWPHAGILFAEQIGGRHVCFGCFFCFGEKRRSWLHTRGLGAPGFNNTYLSIICSPDAVSITCETSPGCNANEASSNSFCMSPFPKNPLHRTSGQRLCFPIRWKPASFFLLKQLSPTCGSCTRAIPMSSSSSLPTKKKNG